MRPKDIGTRTETMVVNYLRENGHPHVERRALHGAIDWGDLTGMPGVAWQIKGGDMAKDASVNQINGWLGDVEKQRINSGSDVGILVVQRRQQNVRNWWAVVTAESHQRLCGYGPLRDTPLRRMAWYCQLESITNLLRLYGHGQRIEW